MLSLLNFTEQSNTRLIFINCWQTARKDAEGPSGAFLECNFDIQPEINPLLDDEPFHLQSAPGTYGFTYHQGLGAI